MKEVISLVCLCPFSTEANENAWEPASVGHTHTMTSKPCWHRKQSDPQQPRDWNSIKVSWDPGWSSDHGVVTFISIWKTNKSLPPPGPWPKLHINYLDWEPSMGQVDWSGDLKGLTINMKVARPGEGDRRPTSLRPHVLLLLSHSGLGKWALCIVTNVETLWVFFFLRCYKDCLQSHWSFCSDCHPQEIKFISGRHLR